jgi:signal transduction histidine kinase
MTHMVTDIERLLDQFSEPHVIIDAEGRYAHLNPAAAGVIGDPSTHVGQPSPFTDSRSQKFHGRLRHTRVGWNAIEFTRIPLELDGAPMAVIRFGLVHEGSRRGRQLDAIVTVAAALNNSDQLDVALDYLAREVCIAVGLESCALTLLEPDLHVRLAGTFGLPDDYAQRLEACRRLGAPLLTVRALKEDRVIIDPRWRTEVLSQDCWVPLHETIRSLRIGTLIAAPVRARDADGRDDVVGALTAFCSEDLDLDDDDVAFLRAMADYAAIAISNARMLQRLRQQTAQEERLRLSRELHDSVTQDLFSLSLRTRALARRPAVALDPPLREEIEELHDMSRRALDQMRATISRGRAIEIGPGGVVLALREQCAKIDAAEGPSVVVTAPDDPNRLPTELQEDVFLLTMEAVRNAVKHAQASHIDVRLDRPEDDPTTLRVTVSDDGTGFISSQRSASAIGLDAMRERAQAHGGSLSIRSAPGSGTVATAVFPDVYNSVANPSMDESRASTSLDGSP